VWHELVSETGSSWCQSSFGYTLVDVLSTLFDRHHCNELKHCCSWCVYILCPCSLRISPTTPRMRSQHATIHTRFARNRRLRASPARSHKSACGDTQWYGLRLRHEYLSIYIAWLMTCSFRDCNCNINAKGSVAQLGERACMQHPAIYYATNAARQRGLLKTLRDTTFFEEARAVFRRIRKERIVFDWHPFCTYLVLLSSCRRDHRKDFHYVRKFREETILHMWLALSLSRLMQTDILCNCTWTGHTNFKLACAWSFSAWVHASTDQLHGLRKL
jgi:hypothetical protein